jgi:uncharacterized protein (DUF1778 family)
MIVKERTKERGRTSRLEARVAPDILALVKRAAEIQGRSVSDFLVAAVEQAARRAIEDTAVIRLTLEGQQQFAEAILNPPPPSPGLKKTAKVYRQLLREAR